MNDVRLGERLQGRVDDPPDIRAEHRLDDGEQRQAQHLAVQADRRVIRRQLAPAAQHVGGFSSHHPLEVCESFLMKGRLNALALPPPGVAVGGEQSFLSDDLSERLPAVRLLRVVAVVVVKDVTESRPASLTRTTVSPGNGMHTTGP